ncbi:phosphotransferase [Alkalicoccus halolimnae]|uniref:Aminoglycoside phosphotransferase family protein n=1 Tax=Alkalicoccus halolimnae TaxID=1667239 RepID=A0A5C7FFV2_9BACI|nr:aminoglycoside phosphotransferase family protein [Alkalicoccus halolimnae]TXF83319.1 aminoglycoside phosphotransferase family protein [Alkalicoccus halolimnae]
MERDGDKEEMLAGGNVSNVHRSGDTVRRELKPESPFIHELLKHLETRGIHFTPKFLGIDEQNREVLSFIEGEAGNYPLKEYMWSNEVLKEIAEKQRSYHEAVKDFPIPNEWKPMDKTPDNLEVICHNDFAVYNIIFNQGKPAGIIDFDVAAPGPRLWDIAYTLYTCVPLSRLYYSETGKAVYYNSEYDAERIKKRVQLFFASYGIEGLEENYLEMVVLRLEGLCTYMKRKAAEGDEAFQKMIKEGHLDHYINDIAFIRKHGREWV